jgi:hypothetical protein
MDRRQIPWRKKMLIVKSKRGIGKTREKPNEIAISVHTEMSEMGLFAFLLGNLRLLIIDACQSTQM